MWWMINAAMSAFFDVLLWPISATPVALQVCVLALPATVFALLVFRGVSNQRGIERSKDLIKAHLLELRLFSDDLLVTLRAQRDIMKNNVRYLGHAVLPMVVMIGPFILMLIQIESRFAFRPLEVGETARFSIEVESGEPVSSLVALLELPDGLVRETPALRDDRSGEIIWRLRAERPGSYEIHVRVGDDAAVKLMVVDRADRISPSIYRASDFETLAYPLEAPLQSDSKIVAAHLDYPRGRGEFAGLSSASWIFFGATLVFGFALRGAFGVTF